MLNVIERLNFRTVERYVFIEVSCPEIPVSDYFVLQFSEQTLNLLWPSILTNPSACGYKIFYYFLSTLTFTCAVYWNSAPVSFCEPSLIWLHSVVILYLYWNVDNFDHFCSIPPCFSFHLQTFVLLTFFASVLSSIFTIDVTIVTRESLKSNVYNHKTFLKNMCNYINYYSAWYYSE